MRNNWAMMAKRTSKSSLIWAHPVRSPPFQSTWVRFLMTGDCQTAGRMGRHLNLLLHQWPAILTIDILRWHASMANLPDFSSISKWLSFFSWRWVMTLTCGMKAKSVLTAWHSYVQFSCHTDPSVALVTFRVSRHWASPLLLHWTKRWTKRL